eukprot:TRINITY_DN1096_c0_g1_i1.p1 TRINITY_DN1096_c0_g1~~TRINITY_DN1096_c0_g1_i1.p1  ORF type:complete len:226 (+),score=14.66 TRINITY_DN1096_c0_g1_i1:216-893(+)
MDTLSPNSSLSPTLDSFPQERFVSMSDECEYLDRLIQWIQNLGCSCDRLALLLSVECRLHKFYESDGPVKAVFLWKDEKITTKVSEAAALKILVASLRHLRLKVPLEFSEVRQTRPASSGAWGNFIVRRVDYSLCYFKVEFEGQSKTELQFARKERVRQSIAKSVRKMHFRGKTSWCELLALMSKKQDATRFLEKNEGDKKMAKGSEKPINDYFGVQGGKRMGAK